MNISGGNLNIYNLFLRNVISVTTFSMEAAVSAVCAVLPWDLSQHFLFLELSTTLFF